MAETEQAPDPLIGRLLAQKFKIERMLGAGAMGRVYLAEQTNLGKQVALKVLHNSMTGDATLAKRFHREAKSASMLAHPNILQIIDFGDDDGLLFIAMELLSGRDLYRAIKLEWPLALDRIGHIGSQILSALDEAHAKGVVHRDLKPENVMLIDVRGESDFVKVCDFGIAKVASERDGEGSAITVAGMVCGTPEYMSPEQARGEPLDGRSDLYAMATILYQMVAGDVPFRAESALGVITKQLHEQPLPPSQRRANVTCPPALESVILRGLSKAREERFASASHMKEALLEALGMRRGSSSGAPIARVGGGALTDVAMAATGVSTPVSTPAVRGASPAFAATAPSPAATPPSSPAVAAASGTVPASRVRGPLVIVAFAVLGVAATGTYVALTRAKPAPSPSAAPASVPAATSASSGSQPSGSAPFPPPASAVSTPNPAGAAVPPPPAAPGAPVPPAEPAIDRAAATPIPNAPPSAPQQLVAMAASHKAHERHAAKPSDHVALAATEPHAAAPAAAPAAGSNSAVAAGGTAAAPAAAKAAAPPAAHTFAGAFADGEQLFRAGDVEGALARYQEAARLNPSDAKTQRQIGKCYNRLGQRDRAMPYIKRYLELAPDASDADFYRAQLDGK